MTYLIYGVRHILCIGITLLNILIHNIIETRHQYKQ